MPTPPPPAHARFKPGQSGNPGGKTPTKWYREFLSACRDGSQFGETRRREYAMRLDQIIMHGEAEDRDVIAAIKLAWSYDMGNPTQEIDHKSTDGSMSPSRVDAITSALDAKLAAPTEPDAEEK